MNSEREEFNEYGVRTNFQSQKPKTSSNPKLSLIIAITVLFSIFNFIVGYMIGKFLGTPSQKNEISEVRHTKEISEITGIPIPSNSKPNDFYKIKNEEVIDLEETEESLLDKTPPIPKKQQTSYTIQKDENKQEVIPKTQKPVQEHQQEKNTSTKDKKTTTISTKQSTHSVKYFIQVSSNEKKEIAESTLKKLKSNGLNAFIQETTINGKKIYRVRVGYFDSYEESVKTLEKVKKISSDAFLAVSK